MELVLGGTFSGKSDFARERALQASIDTVGGVIVLATALEGDPDVRRRIEAHRRQRPREWRTIEEPYQVASAISDGIRLPTPPAAIIVECLTMLVTNLMLCDGVVRREAAFERVTAEVDAIASSSSIDSSNIIIVSNEVGHGLLPTTPDGRLFQELAGFANRRIAAASAVIWMISAGIPTRIK